MRQKRGSKVLGWVAFLTLIAILFTISSLAVTLGFLKSNTSSCTPANSQNATSVVMGTGVSASRYFNQFSPADSAERRRNAALIISIGRSRSLTDKQIETAVGTAIQESGLRNLPGGDLDSKGLFQQRPSVGSWGTASEIMDPVHAINAFYDALVKVKDSGQSKRDLAISVQHPNPYYYIRDWDWSREIAPVDMVRTIAGAQATPTLKLASTSSCNGPSLFTNGQATIGDLSKLGKHIKGDDYPFADRATLVPSGLGYFARECVDFVAWRLNEQIGNTGAPKFNDLGNALTWKDRLVAQGFVADNTPSIGAVAWFQGSVASDGSKQTPGGDPRYIIAGDLGHVAIVSAVNPDGTVILEQYNGMAKPNDHKYSVVKAPASMPGVMYIHVADMKII